MTESAKSPDRGTSGGAPAVAPADAAQTPPGAHLGLPSVDGIAADKFKNIYKHVPLECPNCGFQGKAKIAMLDRTFHCKECGHVFHVTTQGTVPGMRPPEEGRRDPGAPIRLDKPNWIEERFSQLSPAARWTVLTALALALVGIALSFRAIDEGPLSRDLQKRAELAGEALVRGDAHTLKRLTLSGTSEAALEWCAQARPKESAAVRKDTSVRVTVGPMQKVFRHGEKQGKKAKPVADFRTPLVIDVVAASGPQRVTVNLLWVKQGSTWWIDGEWLRQYGKVAEVSAPPDASEKGP